MKNYSIIAMVIAGLLIVPASAYCAESHELAEQIGSGSINWTRGIIQATGIKVPSAKNDDKFVDRQKDLADAREMAQQNLFEVIKGVRIDSDTLVRDVAPESNAIMDKVEGMVKQARTVKQEYLSDGTVEVTMQLSMYAGFTQLVLPSAIKQIESIRVIAPVQKASSSNSKSAMAATNPVKHEVFTGFVVDVRGFETRPAMSPKIFDENGQEVYGPAFVSREFAVGQGMSGYTKDITAAQGNPRVANNPLTVKGLRTKGPPRVDIVISNADACKLRSAYEHLSCLKRCRVIIVVD